MRYTHILFDADDTLLDFQHAEECAIKSTLENCGVYPSPDIISKYRLINHKLWGEFEQGVISKDEVQKRRFERLFAQLGIEKSGDEGDRIYQSFLCKQTWLIMNAEEVCQILNKTTKIAIVTNGVGKTQKMRIEQSRINRYISGLFISEDVGYQKPDTRFFEYVFDKLEIKKSDLRNVLLVGDSLTSDIQGAKNAKIDSCWFNPYDHQTCGIIPTYTITNLKQLPDIVKFGHQTF